VVFSESECVVASVTASVRAAGTKPGGENRLFLRLDLFFADPPRVRPSPRAPARSSGCLAGRLYSSLQLFRRALDLFFNDFLFAYY